MDKLIFDKVNRKELVMDWKQGSYSVSRVFSIGEFINPKKLNID